MHMYAQDETKMTYGLNDGESEFSFLFLACITLLKLFGFDLLFEDTESLLGHTDLIEMSKNPNNLHSGREVAPWGVVLSVTIVAVYLQGWIDCIYLAWPVKTA